MSEEVEDFLAHYGVKGMQWGKRKARSFATKDSSGRKSENEKRYFGLTKKQAIIGASVLVGVAVTAVVIANSGKIKASVLDSGFRNSSLNRGQTQAVDFFDKHADDTDVVLPKGQVFSRIARRAETSVSNSSYVTYAPKDVASYAAFWGPEKNRHQMKIEALSDIKTPSTKTRIDTMVDLIDNPIADPKYKGKTLRQVLSKEQSNLRSKIWINQTSAKKLAEIQYNNMTGDAWDKGIGKIYADKLISKGYGAMSDDRDAKNGIAESPMVLLNSSLFKITSNNQLSKNDIDNAYKEFKQLLRA